MRRLGVVVAALLLWAAAPAQAQDRYSFAGGCYSVAGLADQVRMQATGLGSYLLFKTDETFVTADGTAAEPSEAADWAVTENGDGTFTLKAGERSVSGAITAAEGCATFPEAELNATGTPPASPTAYEKVGGLVEGHMHWMTFEYFGGNFHCGRPWHRYGIRFALPDCAEIEGPQGVAAPLQNFLNYGNPAQPHDTRGYPQMTETRSGNLTYEGTYWRWIQRAWLGGLRLMVMGVNENRVLCQLVPSRRHDCNEMNTMRRGIKAIRELEDYVDAQAGGPGKGFFEIVTNPFQARRVINQGRMAVILEMEISEPFDCRGTGNVSSCTKAQVDAQLDELYKLGLRSSLLLNKFDNPLTGVRFDGGPVGVLINAGNKESSGSFFSARTCKNGELQDNEIFNLPAGSPLDGLITQIGVQPGTFPAYPEAPHCNNRGLTPLGRHVVRRMMDLKMIVNPDHMSQAGVDDTLTLLESRDYSGVISPHGWMDPGNWPRLWQLGGVAFPGHSSAESYVKEWKDFRPQSTPFEFGWGYGADLGGLSQQPRVDDAKGSITYPIKSYDGKVSFERQVTGERTFDYTKEGVAHYGLYPEWFADLERIGGKQMSQDMWDGAEAYLQMWERAHGVPARRCFARGGAIKETGRGPLQLGASWRRTLVRAGQPQQRKRAWSWCVKGPRNAGGKADVAVLGRTGTVVLVGSTARRFAGTRLRVGNAVSFTGLRRRGRFVALARGGRIRAVGVSELSGKPLRRAMLRVVRARASQRQPVYKPGKAESERGERLFGRTLAGTQNQELNERLALLCRLQV